MDKIEFLTGILNKMKIETEKRDEIYKYGVDLINYENEYLECLMDTIEFIAGDNIKADVEWWLWEDVEKKVWMDKEEFDLEKAEDFLRFYLEGE